MGLLNQALDAADVTILKGAGIVGVVLALFFWYYTTSTRSDEPVSLPERIPFFSNTLQFLTNNEVFMKRVKAILQNRTVAKFYLGTQPVYLLSGPHNVQKLFGRNPQVGTEDIFVQRVLPKLYKMPEQGTKLFADDKSGRGKAPLPGWEQMPEDKRMWHMYEHIHTEYLAKTEHLNPIIKAYHGQFSRVLDKFPIGEWTKPMGVVEFSRGDIAECAMSTLLGPKVFELEPKFREAFWEFDDNIFMLTLGFPRWLNAKPYIAQDRYLKMIERYVSAAEQAFDWDGPDAESFWEPHYGARVCRETAKWFTRSGWPKETIAGALGTLLFAQNSNTIPTTIWFLIELVKDPSLLKAVREEVSTVVVENPLTGEKELDIPRLATLPLLQSIFAEVLRLHMNFNIIRHVKEPMTVDGYALAKGSMVQAPMMVAHYDEAVWSAPDHPADEFWAERHIKWISKTAEDGKTHHQRSFAMAGRPSSYFPFGGGPPVCPGRHFAKHEILTTVGLLVSRFDIKLVEWVHLDGCPSDRAAKNDQKYCGAGSMPPDREMMFSIKRLE